MNQDKFNSLLEECDRDIRKGRPAAVAQRLKNLKLARVPREFLLPLARICRRTGLYSLALRLLAGVVKDGQSTSAELAEYSLLLFRSGVLPEAKEKLSRVNKTEVPDALLYESYFHFHNWEYAAAVPLLENYISQPLTPRALIAGKNNLAFALIECRQFDRARVLLQSTLESLSDEYRQARSNCFTLLSQVHLAERDFLAARHALEKAHGPVTGAQTNDQFALVKQQLILDAFEHKSLKPLSSLRASAESRCDWETVRESELLSLKIEFDYVRFLHLYFGSPFEGFRKRMQAELGNLPDRDVYVLGEKSAPRFDLSTGQINDQDVPNPGGKCHQLVDILLRDFFQPLRIAGLFSLLFPGDHFDVDSSPGRVYQVIHRTRRWFKEEKLPLRIFEAGGFYSLKIEGEFSFRVPLIRTEIGSELLQLDQLKKLNGPFTARDASRELGVSVWTARRLLNWAVDERKVERVGESSRSYRYKIAS